MFEYLIDANVLINDSTRFYDYVDASNLKYKILEEVAYEARLVKFGRERIKADSNGNTPSIFVLRKLVDITPKLIDLGILNLVEGNGDALLAATVLTVGEQAVLDFDGRSTTGSAVITDDKKLFNFLEKAGIEVYHCEDFYNNQ